MTILPKLRRIGLGCRYESLMRTPPPSADGPEPWFAEVLFDAPTEPSWGTGPAQPSQAEPEAPSRICSGCGCHFDYPRSQRQCPVYWTQHPNDAWKHRVDEAKATLWGTLIIVAFLLWFFSAALLQFFD